MRHVDICSSLKLLKMFASGIFPPPPSSQYLVQDEGDAVLIETCARGVCIQAVLKVG